MLAAAPAAADAPVKVAILPVRVNATQDHSYLQAGLADMLSSRIGRASDVAVLRVQDPAKATTDTKAAVAAGKAVGAAYVVYGSFTAFGGGASLDLQCAATETAADGSIERRDAFVQAGSLGDIIPQLDDVSNKIVLFAEGRTPSVSSGPPGTGATNPVGAEASASQVRALEKRVEALERVVFSKPKAEPGEERRPREERLPGE